MRRQGDLTNCVVACNRDSMRSRHDLAAVALVVAGAGCGPGSDAEIRTCPPPAARAPVVDPLRLLEWRIREREVVAARDDDAQPIRDSLYCAELYNWVSTRGAQPPQDVTVVWSQRQVAIHIGWGRERTLCFKEQDFPNFFAETCEPAKSR